MTSTNPHYLNVMIIYNVTEAIDIDTEQEWVRWMRTHHIPDVMKTGKFEGYTFSKVLGTPEQDQSASYSLQYRCQNIEQLEKYQNENATQLQKEHAAKFLGKFAAFRTVLEVVE